MIYRQYKYRNTNSNIPALEAADVVMMMDSRPRHSSNFRDETKRNTENRWGFSQCSQRPGGPGGPTGKLPRRLDRTRPQFLLNPVLGHFRTAGLSKDHRPHRVRHYYTVLKKGPQGTVVNCRSPDKDGGDLSSFLHR